MMDQVITIRNRIVDEIFFALGLSRNGQLRRILGPLTYLPAARLARIVAILEDESPKTGISGAAKRILPDLSINVTARGVENLPREGPVLIVSNHPGAYDSVALAASITRQDLKLVASDTSFTRAMINCSQEFIFVSGDTTERMAALRASVQHLRNGGALLIFANGEVEPDPACMPGTELSVQNWSPSLEIMLRKVPQTLLQLVTISGVIKPGFLRNPLIRLRRKPYHRQKMAELFEIIQQMVLPRSIDFHPCILFARPILTSELPQEKMMPEIIEHERQLLKEHIALFY
jgi:hypothetical protein